MTIYFFGKIEMTEDREYAFPFYNSATSQDHCAFSFIN